MQIIRHFIIGVMFPLWIYTRLKSEAHGSRSYYKAYMITEEGSPNYNNGALLKYIRNIRGTYLKYPDEDVLGRSKVFTFNFFKSFLSLLESANYYRIKAPCITLPLEISAMERNYNNQLTKNTPFGRGE